MGSVETIDAGARTLRMHVEQCIPNFSKTYSKIQSSVSTAISQGTWKDHTMQLTVKTYPLWMHLYQQRKAAAR